MNFLAPGLALLAAAAPTGVSASSGPASEPESGAEASVADPAPQAFGPAGSRPTVEAQGPVFRGFDTFVNSLMTDWRVPGLSIAVIKDGRIILLRGYGFRDLARRLPVTPRTLMPIGSNTKAFTATILASLVDEGMLAWDEPVRSYMPDFRLADDVAERLATARDLISHRVGLPRHDALYYGREMTRQDLYLRLAYLPFEKTFRQRWQYNNLMVTVAGMLAERLTGSSWEDLVRQRIFAPLGMNRSNFTIPALERSDDFSRAYADCKGATTPIPYRDIEIVGPAGSINSSAEELIRFVQMQIARGSYGGRRIISERASTEIQYPQINHNRGGPHTRISDQDEGPDGLGPSSYAMGLSLTSYRGHRLLYHGGGIDGFTTDMAWLPDARIGVVVLTNWGEYNPLPTIIERNIFDRLLGLSQVDWNSRAKAKFTDILRQFGTPAAPAPLPPSAAVHRPLVTYAGAYRHPGYGSVNISARDGHLTAEVEGVREHMRLAHVQYDSFRPALQPCSPLGRWGSRLLTFLYDADGNIDRLTIPLEGDVPAIVFRRATPR
jgi:CubicO group peptidase (beta-lactamase class C family)